MIHFDEAPFPEPFGPEYLRPAQPECTDCLCCTAALCERGRASVRQCLGHASADSAAAVAECPCSSSSTPGTLAYRTVMIRAVTRALSKPLPVDVEQLLRTLADPDTPFCDPTVLLPVLTGYGMAEWQDNRPAVTAAGLAYLRARSDEWTKTPVLVHDIDAKAGTARVVVVQRATDRAIAFPVTVLANEGTGLAAHQLAGVVLHAYANCQALSDDEVVLTNVTNPNPPPVRPARGARLQSVDGGLLTGLLSTGKDQSTAVAGAADGEL